jgi:hypothetical protein
MEATEVFISKRSKIFVAFFVLEEEDKVCLQGQEAGALKTEWRMEE